MLEELIRAQYPAPGDDDPEGQAVYEKSIENAVKLLEINAILLTIDWDNIEAARKVFAENRSLGDAAAVLDPFWSSEKSSRKAAEVEFLDALLRLRAAGLKVDRARIEESRRNKQSETLGELFK